MKFLTLISLLFLSLQALQTGEALPTLTLDKDEGGNVDGGPFSSETLTDKVHVIFYVDPDEKDLNNPFSDALKAEDFDRSRFASVAIINMDATWLPNIALDAALKEKQEQFPDTLYVKDLNKKGVDVWNVADDNSDIIITDKAGKVLYVYEGQVPAKEFGTLIKLIKEHL
jgi:predicted transcriptional regulator